MRALAQGGDRAVWRGGKGGGGELLPGGGVPQAGADGPRLSALAVHCQQTQGCVADDCFLRKFFFTIFFYYFSLLRLFERWFF